MGESVTLPNPAAVFAILASLFSTYTLLCCTGNSKFIELLNPNFSADLRRSSASSHRNATFANATLHDFPIASARVILFLSFLGLSVQLRGDREYSPPLNFITVSGSTFPFSSADAAVTKGKVEPET